MKFSFLRPAINSPGNLSSAFSPQTIQTGSSFPMKKISTVSRIMIAVLSLCIIAAYFFPVWRIDLFAPQYPEGLVLKIWLNKLSGDVDIINGLNHYIGMKKLNAAMFPEFSYLVYVVAGFIVYGLLIALSGNRKLLFSYLMISAAGGILAMWDFYRWGYDYGHNLNEDAPIKIPGMGYQPPLLGHKKLLNFDAYSMPDAGGYIIISVVVLIALIWFIEIRNKRQLA
jgi:copper chaperone NosL